MTKWDTAKIQHLEDAIVKNENDIQKYHNDSVVEMQADWNQSDEAAKDYIKNRTHYKEKIYNVLWDNAEATKEPYYFDGEIDGWELIS